jgi:hypothetical protein
MRRTIGGLGVCVKLVTDSLETALQDMDSGADTEGGLGDE